MTVGVLTGAHGVRGAMRLRPETDFPERLNGRRVWLEGRSGRWSRIERAQPYRRGFYIVQLDGVADRAVAEELRGYAVQVPVEDLPPLPEGRYYHHQIVGLRVCDREGTDLGEVVAIERTGANDVYAVRSAGGREWLLPAIRDVVVDIDLDAGRIVIQPIPGLLGG